MGAYEGRLAKLEAQAAQEPMLVCVFGDEDPVKAIANARVSGNWPDDDWHPITVMNLLWSDRDL